MWIGDDAAVVPCVDGFLVTSADMSVQDVHANLDLINHYDFGWRAFASALSDLAAMAAIPLHSLVCIACPSSTDIDKLYTGIAAAAKEHNCPIVGGDISKGQKINISITVNGYCPHGPIFRSGAKVGDSIFVTAPLGASSAGLAFLNTVSNPKELDISTLEVDNQNLLQAHLRPLAKINQGLAAQAGGASSMIDVSDGLATDLNHIAIASGIGIELDSVPIAKQASLEQALGGGEDYELIFTASDPAKIKNKFKENKLLPPIEIGHCVAQTNRRTLAGKPFAVSGWRHF